MSRLKIAIRRLLEKMKYTYSEWTNAWSLMAWMTDLKLIFDVRV
jgi:hypothetical protein